MTQAVISLEAGLEIASSVLRDLKNYNRSAVLAGGFLRDIQLGVAPKDLDFYISAAPEEGVDHQAMMALHAMGCDGFRKLGPEDHNYAEGLNVYEALHTVTGYPVQLIFTPPFMEHPLKFDFGLCESYMWGPEHGINNSGNFNRDVRDNTLTILCGRDSFAQQMTPTETLTAKELESFIGHLNRMQYKYPERQLVMSANFIATVHGRQVYNHLIEEGYIEDPRALFPTQRREPEGDEVRLEDGAEGGGEVGGQQHPDVGPEAEARGIPDIPQVQPGFGGRAFDAAWIEEVLANARDRRDANLPAN